MARERGVSTPGAFALALLLAAMAAACGGGKSAGPKTGDTAGSGSGPGGGSSGGPSDGGTSDSGGTSSGGTTAGGTSSGGSRASGGTTGSGGGAAGGGTSGGSSACAALLATFDAGRTLRVDTPRPCVGATTTSDGLLAMSTADQTATVYVWGPDGGPRLATISSVYGSAFDPRGWLRSTTSGFAARVGDSPHTPPIASLRFFDRSGATLATSADKAADAAPDGHGGVVIAARRLGPTLDLIASLLEWFDGSGSLLRVVGVDDDPFAVAVAPQTGHVLSMSVTDGTLHARWYDGSGNPISSVFDTGLAPGYAQVLVDGTVALADPNGWRGIVRDGVGGMGDAPAWLASRPKTTLAAIRGGSGYAVLGSSRAVQEGTRQFEIVTPSGESCGTMSPPPASADPGVSATAISIDVGDDGTVLETDALSGANLGPGPYHCELRWWPALLH